MKILLINKYHYRKGGAERAYFDMAEMLQKAGHEVAFFAMDHPKNEATPWSKYFVSQVDYHEREQSLFQKLRAAFRIIWNREANKKLSALIADFQPDIAHAHNIYHQLSPSIFHTLKKRGVPLVLTLHDYKLVSPNYMLYANGKIWDHSSGFLCIKDRCVQGSLSKSLVCAIEKWLHATLGSYRLVDILIAPSQFLALKVQELGWRGIPIEVVPNPLRTEELQAESSQEEIIKDRLVFFGRFSHEKGIPQILQALIMAPEKHLLLIGEGPEQARLELLAETLGVADRVTWLGPKYGASLQRELQKAEAVIVPSLWYENLPYVITESLALGVVVIASASGGITERIQHNENGFLYPQGDTEALGTVIKNLNNQDLSLIRKKAKESVQDLQPDLFIKKIETLYGTLL